MAACQGSTCRSGRRPCLSPEKCGMFNEVREMRIYLEEEMQAAERIERWGLPIALAALVVIVLALFVVSNWRSLAALAGA